MDEFEDMFGGFEPDDDGDNKPEKYDKPEPPYKLRPGQIFESRCHVCSSPARNIIEQQMAAGVPDAHIAQNLENAGIAGVTRKSVGTHRRKHFTLADDAVRRIVERRAREVIENIDDTEEMLLTTKGILESMAHLGMKALLSGESKIEARDLITVLDKIESVRKAEQGAGLDEMMKDYQAFAQAVKHIVPEDMWNEIDKEFDRILEGQKGLSLDRLIDMNSLKETV